MTAIQEYTLNRSKAAIYLDVSVSTLARWASHNVGPSYFILGGKARYREDDLKKFVEQLSSV